MRKIIVLLLVLLISGFAVAQESDLVQINWQVENERIGGIFPIRGTANPAEMRGFFLEVASYDPVSSVEPVWQPITIASPTPVVEGMLGQWDTTVFADGVYQLRLRVILNSGEAIFDVVAPITIDNSGAPPPDTDATAPPVVDTPEPQMTEEVIVEEPTVQPTPTALPPVQGIRLPAANGNVLEVGAHVLHFTDTTQLLMRGTGLSWVKWQIPFHIGQDLVVPRDRIERTKRAGFKVLLSVTGEKEDLATMGVDYYPIYAEFVAQVAALGPDAIEIWNEMNLDREWPEGQISPDSYALMLSQAYIAIKTANPNVMVITGALAPTGAEGAFGLDKVWNDDRYYEGMARAGVDAYADCIGVHYNEGIIAPSQQGGDPRDDYPTRYLPLMLDRVRFPFRNSDIPLCFTEMGYLSGEGFDTPIPDSFNWAAGTSVAEQAQWVAEAIQIAANYQQKPVLLMIIWNMDFDNFDQDPQAGYALIRPDGTCPACQTLAQLK